MALFSYEGQTNNLKVVSTGQGGLEEMIEELNSGLIMYAFCRVIDNKTSLPKCLLINWQGDGAPIVRKGTCANHIRDIERLLKGVHITITARSEEEVEVDLIMEKLARATGSAYKFNERRGENGSHKNPVGTTYRRVNPEQEINATERDKFWQKEEIEEKERLEQERIKSEQNRQKLEKEIRMREEKENQIREEKIIVKKTTSQRTVEHCSEELKNIRNQQTIQNSQNSISEVDTKSRSEELRQQRNNEAQKLIAQRTINARAIFEQNTCAGQLKTPCTYYPVEQKSNNVDISRNTTSTTTATTKSTEDSERKEESKELSSSLSQPQINNEELKKNECFNSEQSHGETVNPQSEIESQIKKGTNVSKLQNEESSTTVEEAENQLYSQLEGEYLYLDPNNEGMKARALYDYQAADDTEITFDPGDIITHIDAIDEGWWQGLGPDGTYGLFPANHVEVIN
ncbi:drebrin-like protein isoform X2 [Leptopilina boulardi]|uniref:drebrin-like protein isoform X2 n=1 Tax=Leptopilina boulardi TaxID=63433 RepID=UPI0021F61035|nr:drebrin-like protein isoform X2 [Leptopilina boulardi]